MNKKNALKQLNRTHEHRKALLNNMVTSLFEHESIESTLAKLKVVRSHAEKLITRAKKNLGTDLKQEQILHNKREVMRRIKDRGVVVKLFEDIAPRFKDVNGGYTRIYKLVNRPSDNSEVAILELVGRKTRDEIKEAKRLKREAAKAAKNSSKDKSASGDKKSKK